MLLRGQKNVCNFRESHKIHKYSLWSKRTIYHVKTSGGKLYSNPYKQDGYFNYHQIFNSRKGPRSAPHSVFMCFVWIWEGTAIISLYNINWLVFITETECVYSAVRTGSLNVIQFMCFVWISEQTAIISLYSINWLVFIRETVCVYCAVRTGYLNVTQVKCFVWIWEQTAIISLYSINWLVFITETECVYCAVGTGYLNVIQVNLNL